MKTITFDETRNANPGKIIIGVRTDNEAETLRFELPALEADQLAVLYWTNGVYGDVVTLEDGMWTVDKNMTRESGRLECFVRITHSGNVIWNSHPFECYVVAIPAAEEAIEKAYPSAIQQGVEEARSAARDAQAAADAARESAEGVVTEEAARQEAENARREAEILRESAEAGRVSAENSRAEAESAREISEAARVIAENSRVAAERERVAAEQGRVAAENERVAAFAGYQGEIDGIKGDLSSFQDNITVINETRETIEPTWESGQYYFSKGVLISISNNIHAVLQCYAGDVFDISMRTNSAAYVQPLILTRKVLTDESFDYATDVIYAENLEADQNPYTTTLTIEEDCYLYINRREVSTVFPFSMERVIKRYAIKNEVMPDTDVDKLNTYNINAKDTAGVVKTDDGYEVTIKKTDAALAVYLDMSACPISDRMMLAYKITPIQMDVEKFNYNFFGNYYRNRNCRSIYRNSIGIPKTEYMKLERMSDTPGNMNMGFALGSSNLQGLNVKSAYTNGVEREYLSDDEILVKFLISDIRVIDFSKTTKGYEPSTNLEYHIDDVFAENIYVDENDYVKHERSIYGFGDSIMMATKYRDLSWIQQLYVPGYKLNILYDTNNNGHISNKTRDSVYFPSSYTSGFVDKIVKDSVDVGEDITIFALGIHDYSQNTQGTGYCRLGEIGKKESDGNYNWCTVAGAIETILKKVTSDSNKRFLWVNVAANKYGLFNDVDFSVREENEIIKQACSNWGVQVSDVFGKMGMNPSNIGGNNIWDGGYTDGYKYDDTGALVEDELYFVTDTITVDPSRKYKTLWVTSGSNKCYLSCFDVDGNWIRNNAEGWGILPDNTATIKYNVPKASSVEEMTSIANSPERGFVSVEEESLTRDSVHLTDKSYRRYLDIINKDVIELVKQDE